MEISKFVKETCLSTKKRINTEEESEFIRLLLFGSEKEKVYAKDKLVRLHIRNLAHQALVVYHTFPHGGKMEPMDLLMEGVRVFLEMLPGFDLSRGCRLTTYYTREVKTRMQRFVMSYAIVLPSGSVYLNQIASKKAIISSKLQQKEQRRITLPEEAKAMNISSDILELIDAYTNPKVLSMAACLNILPDTSTEFIEGSDKSLDVVTLLKEKFPLLTEAEIGNMINNIVLEKPISVEIMERMELTGGY